MFRKMFIALFAVAAFAQAAPAQEWAKKLFRETSHDFGTVARGAKAEYRFEMVNCYVEDVRIASVRTTCGCTTPEIEKQVLKTWEKGAIIAKLNTRSFLGRKGATIIVTIDRPYFAEVQLFVDSYIRSDVVLHPGAVQFGDVDQGAVAERTIQVDYAGRSDWEIVDVRSANTNFEVELTQTQRGGGRVTYDMLVRLKATAPEGYINDQLTIVTNDQSSRTIPLPVEGRVVASLTVSPAALSLGTLRPGETVTRQLVVRGRTPFRVVKVGCDAGDPNFQFEKPEEAKLLQFIPVTFTAGGTPGRIVRRIEIETDSGAHATCVATAEIKPADEP